MTNNVIDLAAARAARRTPKPHPDQDAHEAAFRELTEAAAKAYRGAAKARAAGDLVGAEALSEAALEVLLEAGNVGLRIARP